jgi:hypothetical protein
MTIPDRIRLPLRHPEAQRALAPGLAAKNNQSRYDENDYRRHNTHEGIPAVCYGKPATG